MTRILNLPALLLLFVAALFMTSCEEDGTGGGTGGGTANGPSMTLLSPITLDVLPGEAFTIEFSAVAGDSPLQAVTVFEDGVKVPLERLKFNGEDAAANPPLLLGADKESLTWTTTIVAQASANTDVIYAVQVSDEAQLQESVLVTVTASAIAPTITGNPPMVFEVTEGSKNGFILTGSKGTGDLSSIEVRQDGQLVDAAALEWDGVSMMTAGNPFPLSGDEVNGFVETRLFITLPMGEGVYTYDFILEDSFNLRDTVSYVVTTVLAGTPIEIREDVLLNSAGPAGNGGLDLDTGESTGTGPTSGAEAEIRDNGIDTNLPDDVNWIRTISAMNGATIKYVVPGAGVPEGFTFDAVAVKEELAGIYDNSTSSVIDETNSTAEVQAGDMFIVRKGDQHWLLVTKEVNTRTGDNLDNYVFDVKF